MKTKVFAVIAIVLFNYPTSGQEIAGLSYCLLFDSSFEKQAFHSDDDIADDPLAFLLAHNPEIDSSKYLYFKAELSEYACELEVKRNKLRNDYKFLRYVFYAVHSKYLKHYNRSEVFQNVLQTGKYNCVSGTALYACLLLQLGFVPDIYETRYHIFLTVDLGDGGWILFEATDPVGGFVDNKRAVSQRISEYLKNEEQIVKMERTLSAPFNVDAVLEAVSLRELAGLHYYNLAVDLINCENYYDAFRALKKASMLYPKSERIKDFTRIAHARYETQLAIAFVNK